MKNHITLSALLILTLCGCSLEKRVDKTMAKIQEQYATAQTWDALPVRTLSWKQAVMMMQERNADLMRQRDIIRESERNELSVYTQMIPGVTYYTYFTSSLRDLTDQVNSDQFATTLNINFFLPTLTRVPYQVYAGKATTYAQMKALEGKQRELIASLYKIVRSQELADAVSALEEADGTEEEEKQRGIPGNGRQIENRWGEMAKLLGNSEARWVVLPETMPHVRWENYKAKLDKLDDLIVCQFAMRLEQSRMAQYGVALQYLPSINTNLYSPSLFSSSGGTYSGAFLNSKDTKLNMSINYSLDTKMDQWNLYMRSKARYEQTKQEIAAQLMDYRNKLKTMQQSFSEYVLWQSVMRKRLDFLYKTAPQSAEEYLERKKNISAIKKELLNQENQALETEAALILQYGLAG